MEMTDSPWCYTKSCKQVKKMCLSPKPKCCQKAKICALVHPRRKTTTTTPPTLSPVEAIKSAFSSAAGVMVSASADYLIDSDSSGSLIRSTLPQGLINSPFPTTMFDDGLGVIFSPTQLPPMQCGYIGDAGTDERLKDGPDLSRCGATKQYPTSSGACPLAETAQSYVERYYFEPSKDVGYPRWELLTGQCYVKTYEDVLDRQQGMWDKLRADATEQQWNEGKLGESSSGPTNYNEMVLQGVPDIFAYFWSHDGDFITPMEYVPGNSGTSAICCIAIQFCPTPPQQPLIQIAQQYISGAKSMPWSDFTAYKNVMSTSGGYDANSIFKELPWSEVCDTTFLNKCNKDIGQYSRCVPR